MGKSVFSILSEALNTPKNNVHPLPADRGGDGGGLSAEEGDSHSDSDKRSYNNGGTELSRLEES